MNASACEPIARSRFYQNHNTTYIKPNATYTASAYIKTKDIEAVEGASGYGAAILVFISAPSMPDTVDPEAADFVSEFITGTTDETINDGWRRVSVTFTTPSDVSLVRFNGIIRGATGTAYFDGMQLEEGSTLSPYNMMENGSFERSSNSFPTSWTKGNDITSKETVDTSKTKHGNQSMTFGVSAGKKKNVYQTVKVAGKESDTYIVSGWGYGKRMKQEGEERKFKISIKITYSDGSTTWQSPLEFNTSVSEWQYGAKIFNLSDGTSADKTPTGIGIYLMMYNQANTLYFDNVQLIRADTEKISYDSDGNIIQDEGGSYTYDENGNMLTSKDLLNRVTSYDYDDDNNLTDVESHSGIHSHMTYDSYGNIISSETSSKDDAHKIRIEKTYDSTGSFVTSDTDEHGNTSYYDYDETKGLLTSFTDRKGRMTSYAYDSDDLLSSVSSLDRNISYSYNDDDRLSEIASSGASYSFVYDGFGNRTETKIGETIVSSVTYGQYNGDIVSSSLSNGYEKTYAYDEAGRIISESVNDQIIAERIYDSKGNIDEIIDCRTDRMYRYEYDFRNRVIGIHVFDMETDVFHDNRIYGVQFGYDEHDRLIREVYYDKNHRDITDYTYGDEDKVISTSHNGDTITYTYDSLDRLISKSIDTASPVESNYTYQESSRGEGYATSLVESEMIGDIIYIYEYDDEGNITKISEHDGDKISEVIYTYDEHDQLISESYSSGEVISYQYDSSGNIISRTENGAAYAYVYENEEWSDQLTSYDGTEITYDSIGNPLSYRGYVFAWNGRELVSASKGSSSMTYEYDSSSLRTKKTVNDSTVLYEYVGDRLTREIRDDMELCYSYDHNGTISKLTLIRNGNETVYHIITNTRGDVDSIYDESGTLQARYVYGAYGNIISIRDSSGNEITDSAHIGHINPIRYRGYYYDSESGFYYVSSRYYDPEVGRFISADSGISGVGGDIRGYNMYSYCFNNPVNMSDPDGNWPKWVTNVVVGVGVALCVAAVTVLTCGVGTATLAGAVAVGTAKGTLIGAATGAAIGAGIGYKKTKTLKGAVNGAAIGFGIGTLVGAAVGGAISGAKFGTFSSKASLTQHFDKHGKEFKGIYDNVKEYAEGAKYVIKNGTYISEKNAYVRFLGSNGKANYAFVGMKSGGRVSTFHVRSVSEMAKDSITLFMK